ncbi:ribbon-helix-helix protein, CopG family [Coraliomargarita algicola]|uniref:Ribbon-helix-helix protein, CopG family n=1 Tax=Coraliomargarita algicola TaxID=3092156 RepID=A0ABZ0RFC5_9BACT|nr:ribbon-helix-helix protein, CopG family [Coraliomargarita sp. J2-16]WPJ94203.1 ribbon-helix-helix protein, CopG family [Coraliomargarita sp. J2-16]
MSESVTTSIRLSPRLRRALEQRAQAERRGKNWVISRALEKYLEEGAPDLEAEARRQSILASQPPSEDWGDDADFEQWM